MKTLLSGSYSPKGTLPYYERAVLRRGDVTYCGIPYRAERVGYDPDVNLADFASRGSWDWFFFIEEWRSVFPVGIEKVPFPTVAYLPDACYDIARRKMMAQFFDYVFISQRWLVEEFRRVNPQTYYLPFAFDPARRRGFPLRVEPVFDVGFVGSLDKGRARALDELSKRFKVNDYRVDFGAKPLEYATETYLRSKIVFNRLPPGYGDYNLRVFEALGLGRFLLTDRPNGRAPVLKHQEHLVYYQPDDNLVDLVRRYLDDESGRERVADAGQRETLEKHTFDHRVQAIWEVMTLNDFRMQAPLRKARESRVFLDYQKVFARLMMLNSMAQLFALPGISVTARLRALPYVLASGLRRFRQMAWRKTAESLWNHRKIQPR